MNLNYPIEDKVEFLWMLPRVTRAKTVLLQFL